MQNIFTFTVSVISIVSHAACGMERGKERVDKEIDIAENIMRNYPAGGYITPTNFGRRPVEVETSLQIGCFQGINDERQEISFNGVLSLEWTDDFITECGKQAQSNQTGVSMRMPASEIWTPLVLQGSDYKNALKLVEMRSNTIVKLEWDEDSSSCQWNPTGNFLAQCDLDYRIFPFDFHICLYTFQMLSDIDQVVMVIANNSDPVKFKRGEQSKNADTWELLFVKTELHSEIDVTYNTVSYSTITFKFVAKRRAYYYVLTIIIPSVMVSCIQLFALYHPHCPEKPAFFIVTLLAFWVIQQVITDIIPETSKKCALLSHLGVQSVICVVNTIASIFCLRALHSDQVSITYRMASSGSQEQQSSNPIWKAKHLKRKRAEQIVNIVDNVLFVAGLSATLLSPVLFYLRK